MSDKQRDSYNGVPEKAYISYSGYKADHTTASQLYEAGKAAQDKRAENKKDQTLSSSASDAAYGGQTRGAR